MTVEKALEILKRDPHGDWRPREERSQPSDGVPMGPTLLDIQLVYRERDTRIAIIARYINPEDYTEVDDPDALLHLARTKMEEVLQVAERTGWEVPVDEEDARARHGRLLAAHAAARSASR